MNKSDKRKLKSFEEKAKKLGCILGYYDIPADIPAINRKIFYHKISNNPCYLGHIDEVVYFVSPTQEAIDTLFEYLTRLFNNLGYATGTE